MVDTRKYLRNPRPRDIEPPQAQRDAYDRIVQAEVTRLIRANRSEVENAINQLQHNPRVRQDVGEQLIGTIGEEIRARLERLRP